MRLGKFIEIVLLATTVVVLAACAPPSVQPEEAAPVEEVTPETVPAEPLTVTVWSDSYFTPQWEGAQGPVLEKIWNRFEEENNIKIALEVIPGGEMQSKLLMALKAGTAPDAVIADQYWLASMVEVGGVQPLNDLWPEEDRKDFLEWTLDGVTVDGNVYGIWYSTDVRGLFYRKDMLEAAGFTEPPKTWDQLHEYAKKLTTKDVYGIGVPGFADEATMIDLLIDFWSQGGELVDEEGNPVFHEGKNREALLNLLNFYKKLFDEGLTPPDTVTVGEEAMMPRITGGGLAMFFGCSWQMAVMVDTLGPEEAAKWAMALRPVPPGGKPVVANGGFMLSVLADDPVKKEAAWKFIWHLAQPENMAAFDKASRDLPVRKSIWETEFFREDLYMQTFAEFLPYGKTRPNAVIYPVISDKLSRTVGEVLTGQKTPEQAVDDAYKAVTESM